ncbi:MAG: folate-binding protein [Gammaproteobacteria bacterium]|nr:folate-binding protein [Gammaproteobacteria bacterium]MDH3858298.1 folate-binding protein [Gammaproteobacteria bacterium]
MKQWQEFESKQSSAQAANDFICAVDEIGLIMVSGADATDFLQNQLSNDINLIDESRYQLSSYSTPKGRMLGVFRVIRVSNGYLLLTTASIVVPLLEHLYKYIVQSQVTLADASNYFARFAVQTGNPENVGKTSTPGGPGTVMQTESMITLQLEPLGSQRRFLLMFLSADEAIDFWESLAGSLQVAGYSSWHLSEIKAGIPVIYPATAGEFVLQMTNLGALGGVSFDKGCYPGQEIVARMQYLGKLKRRMFLARIETDTLPAPGDDLVTPGKTVADGSGKVVDAEFDLDGNCHCLYIAQISKAESGSLQLLKQPGSRIDNVDLPYVLEI